MALVPSEVIRRRCTLLGYGMQRKGYILYLRKRNNSVKSMSCGHIVMACAFCISLCAYIIMLCVPMIMCCDLYIRFSLCQNVFMMCAFIVNESKHCHYFGIFYLGKCFWRHRQMATNYRSYMLKKRVISGIYISFPVAENIIKHHRKS